MLSREERPERSGLAFAPDTGSVSALLQSGIRLLSPPLPASP